MEVPESLIRKERKEGEQTLTDLSSAHCCSQAKYHLVQTNYIKQTKFLVCHIINILLCLYRRILTSVVCTDLTAFGLPYGPPAFSLPYRPPVCLIQTKNGPHTNGKFNVNHLCHCKVC